ncbi:hypothetical protein IscW_ISCW021974, partial [Ixodes scapularis]
LHPAFGSHQRKAVQRRRIRGELVGDLHLQRGVRDARPLQRDLQARRRLGPPRGPHVLCPAALADHPERVPGRAGNAGALLPGSLLHPEAAAAQESAGPGLQAPDTQAGPLRCLHEGRGDPPGQAVPSHQPMIGSGSHEGRRSFHTETLAASADRHLSPGTKDPVRLLSRDPVEHLMESPQEPARRSRPYSLCPGSSEAPRF